MTNFVRLMDGYPAMITEQVRSGSTNIPGGHVWIPEMSRDIILKWTTKQCGASMGPWKRPWNNLKWIYNLVGQVWVPGMGMKQLKVTC